MIELCTGLAKGWMLQGVQQHFNALSCSCQNLRSLRAMVIGNPGRIPISQSPDMLPFDRTRQLPRKISLDKLLHTNCYLHANPPCTLSSHIFATFHQVEVLVFEVRLEY